MLAVNPAIAEIAIPAITSSICVCAWPAAGELVDLGSNIIRRADRRRSVNALRFAPRAPMPRYGTQARKKARLCCADTDMEMVVVGVQAGRDTWRDPIIGVGLVLEREPEQFHTCAPPFHDRDLPNVEPSW